MSEMFHQPAKCLLAQAMVLIASIFIFTLAHAAQVSLAWDPNDPAPDGYRVFQRLEGGAYDFSSPVWPQTGDNPQSSTCVIGNLAEATTYYFVVRAYVGNVESGDSNEISFRYNPPAPTIYTLSVSAGVNGSITPGTTTVDAGSSQTFSIVPQAHYHVADVQVDGNSVGTVSSYTFNQVNADHTISASFAADTYTITAGAGAHGSITPSGTVSASYGSSRSFTIAADSGYHVADVLVDSVSAGPVSAYTFNYISASHTIAAVFDANSFTISSSAGVGGTISPAGQIVVAAGASQSFNLTADTGYEIQDLVVDGVSVGAQGSYTFVAVQSNHAVEVSFVQSNQPPVADAGPDQVVDDARMVTLNGANSNDADDGIAAFQWRQIQGPAVDLSAPGQEITTFQAPDVDMAGQALVFELTVTDYQAASAKDTCIVNVTRMNQVPTADAGADQTVAEGKAVTLNAAASTDMDDGIAGYSWVQIQGPQVILSDPQSATPEFTAPDVGPQGVSLIFEVTVSDAGGLKDTDRCNVSVTGENLPPVADAGADQTVSAGIEVALDGSLSLDSDGAGLLYQWRQTDGPPVTLSDATAVDPVFAVPADSTDDLVLTFSLTVTDNGGLQGVDTCQVIVQAASPQPGPAPDTNAPVLVIDNPANDYIVTISRRINISGTASDDQQVDRVVWVNDRGQTGEAIGTVSWHIDGMHLRRGENTFLITAYDAAGNFASKTITVRRTSH